MKRKTWWAQEFLEDHPYLLSSNSTQFLNPPLSGFFSEDTESALLQVCGDLLEAKSSSSFWVLIWCAPSVVLDTVDPLVLDMVLGQPPLLILLPFPDTSLLCWVSILASSLKVKVLQNSCLWPLLFSIHTLFLCDLIQLHSSNPIHMLLMASEFIAPPWTSPLITTLEYPLALHCLHLDAE